MYSITRQKTYFTKKNCVTRSHMEEYTYMCALLPFRRIETFKFASYNVEYMFVKMYFRIVQNMSDNFDSKLRTESKSLNGAVLPVKTLPKVDIFICLVYKISSGRCVLTFTVNFFQR